MKSLKFTFGRLLIFQILLLVKLSMAFAAEGSSTSPSTTVNKSIHSTSPKKKAGLALILSPIQRESRLERDGDDRLNWNSPSTLGVGILSGKFQFMIDHAQTDNDSGNAALHFSHRREEWDLSAIYRFHSTSDYFHLGAGLGLGTYEDRVQSLFYGKYVEDGSEKLLKASMILSGQGNWKWFYYGLETRFTFAKQFEPQPVFSWLARLGLQFTIF